MMRLLVVETRRLWLRRLTWFTLFAGLLVIGLTGVATWQQAQPVSAAEQAQSDNDYQQALKDWQANGEQMLKDCLQQQAEAQKTDPKADFQCQAASQAPQREWFGRQPPSFLEIAQNTTRNAALTVGFLVFLIGASAVAAEFTTGAIGTWLTFEPRRLRVLTSKLVATGVTGFLASAALVALLVGTTYAISRYAGTVGALPSDGLRALGLLTLRVTAAATLAGLVGASLGALTRHTGAAIAVALGYAVAIEGFVRAWKPELAPFLVDPNLNAWIGGQSTYSVPLCSTNAEGFYSCTYVEHTLWQADGARFGGIVVALLILVALWAFRQRDVT